MADALVSFMLEKLTTVIQDEIQQEVHLVVGAENEVENLKTTFKQIHAVLNDAEQRQIKDEAVKLWLEEFKNIAYDMDDVLDEWSFEMKKTLTNTGLSNKKKVCSYLRSLCACFSKAALRHNIGTQILKIKERLDQTEMNKKRFGLIEIKSNDKPIERLKSSSFVDVTNILGRVTDKETIMSKLMFLGESSTSTTQPESSSTQALHAPNIVSIVGMGGLGKTCLAQLVFNDDQVKTHFEKTMWVCVSEPFHLVTVTKSIIKEANCKVPNSSEWDETLHRSLIESLKGKRFFLVLDDVWTEDRTIWENLELSFKYGAKGSRILVTTRNERVALMMNATYIHSLGVLSNDDCSSLLNRIALAGDNMKTHEDLREIGDKISKKCKGLPLAAKTLGGLLHFNKSKTMWLNILDSEIWKLEEEVVNGFLKPSLLLSYYDLPLPLKGCFLYCSIFPKDHVIEKDLLVKLWMAQGFLNKSTSGNEDLEVTGEDYFNNLAMRSFFQDFIKDTDGEIISCKMHDLVHDLAQYLTKNECDVKHYNGTQILDFSSRVRHLTILCENDWGNSTSAVCNAKKLRTLQILNGQLRIKEAPAHLFRQYRCLKVLCLNRIGLENLSYEIGNLIHLRYLDLSDNDELKILPETISNLYNLQTLKLQGCWSLCELPREMRRMINLRHLDLRGTSKLSYIPQGFGGLTSLRTLCKFIVGGARKGCKISELKNLNLLQGDLNIQGLGRVETVNEALEMVLKQKQLHSLMLDFKPDNEERLNGLVLSKRMEDVLDVLEPHPDVVNLRVYYYLGFKLSRWMESTSILSHIKTLNLYDCINLTKFPAFGQLPSLEVLHIEEATEVKHIGFEFYSSNSSTLEHVNCRVPFPKLKVLRMMEMKNLEVWELQHVVVMPCLHLITVEDCPKLKVLPAFGQLPSLEVLDIKGATEVKHIGFEFYSSNSSNLEHVNCMVPFPKLKELRMEKMKNLEVWELQHGVVMPCLRLIEVDGCPRLKALPAFGQLPSLEVLDIKGATEVKHIGFEFYSSNSSTLEHVNCRVPFPKLKELRMEKMWNLEVWELQHGVVMPCLRLIKVNGCPKLKALPALGKLPSLEKLFIQGADKLRHIGCEFLYEVDDVAAAGEVRFNNNNNTAAFPKLKDLLIVGKLILGTFIMGSKEMEWELEEVVAAAFPILPCLRELVIGGFRNSKPFVEILSKISSLEILEIHGEATEFIKYIRHDDDDDLHTARETILFPNLKELRLYDMEDMEELKIGFQVMPLLSSLQISYCYKLKAIQGGSLSKLELLELGECDSLYELGIPNLKRLKIERGPIHPSLPEAFATTLQATLEELAINCRYSTWTCVPEQVQQLTSLKRLELWGCGGELEQRCRKDEGEDWRIISHIPNIRINYDFMSTSHRL